MTQKGFSHILLSLVFVGVFILAGITLWTMSKNKHHDQNFHTQSPSATTAKKNICSVASGMVEVPRETADSAFMSAITNIDSISVISPGKLVGDSRFTYLWIKNQQRVPVYAPADGTLIKISYKNRVDLPPGMSTPDYDLTFLVDCHTMYRFNHITDPNPEIAALKPIAVPLQIGKGYPAPSDKDTNPKSNIMVKVGQQIGTTTGTPAAHNWDFGLFIDQVSTCPYEKFNEPIRSAWLALLGDITKPIKGTACEVNGNY